MSGLWVFVLVLLVALALLGALRLDLLKLWFASLFNPTQAAGRGTPPVQKLPVPRDEPVQSQTHGHKPEHHQHTGRHH